MNYRCLLYHWSLQKIDHRFLTFWFCYPGSTFGTNDYVSQGSAIETEIYNRDKTFHNCRRSWGSKDQKRCWRVTEKSLSSAPEALVWLGKSELPKESKKPGMSCCRIGPWKWAGGKVMDSCHLCIVIFLFPTQESGVGHGPTVARRVSSWEKELLYNKEEGGQRNLAASLFLCRHI